MRPSDDVRPSNLAHELGLTEDQARALRKKVEFGEISSPWRIMKMSKRTKAYWACQGGPLDGQLFVWTGGVSLTMWVKKKGFRRESVLVRYQVVQVFNSPELELAIILAKHDKPRKKAKATPKGH